MPGCVVPVLRAVDDEGRRRVGRRRGVVEAFINGDWMDMLGICYLCLKDGEERHIPATGSDPSRIWAWLLVTVAQSFLVLFVEELSIYSVRL